MNNASKVVKNRFWVQFNLVLSQGSEVVKNNDESTKPLITRKHRPAITDTEKKAVQDYYFNLVNRKSAYKYVQKWFLREFRHLLSQSTISKLLSTTFTHLNTGTSRLNIKK